MSDYRINFNGSVSVKDTASLELMLGIIDDEDKLTIALQGTNENTKEAIMKLLYENGFECRIFENGGEEELNITAVRRNRDMFEGIH